MYTCTCTETIIVYDIDLEYTEAEDQRKAGKAWEHSSHEWMQGGRREGEGGGGAMFKYVHVDA